MMLTHAKWPLTLQQQWRPKSKSRTGNQPQYATTLKLKDKNEKYTLSDYTYSFPLDVPFLSGCFMLFNAKVYKLIDGFDTNYFMYFEDVDICRKVRAYNYRTVVYPFVTVVHDHEFKSLFKLNTFIYLIKSSIYYFNKWGWIFDKQKHFDNNLTISKISSLK